MPTSLLLAATVALLMLAVVLISGRALAPNLAPRVTRDDDPLIYWLQVGVLAAMSVGLLIAAIHASPVILRH